MEDLMPKKIDPQFRKAYRKVLTEAAGNPAFRQGLLGKNKKAAESKIAEVVSDPKLVKKIASSIYSGATKYRKLNADTKKVIKLMAYVFGNLPLPPTPAAGPKAASLGIPAGDCFEEGEDWESI
jgi:hypothetical protein